MSFRLAAALAVTVAISNCTAMENMLRMTPVPAPPSAQATVAPTVHATARAAMPLPIPTPTRRPVPKPTPKPNIVATTITSGWIRSLASMYGGSDGFWYNHFACGGTYYPNVVGVANRTLRCGTRVMFKYYGRKVINGRSVRAWYYATIRVVDRGPYCCGRSWDFTTAAAKALGFYGVGTVYYKIVH